MLLELSCQSGSEHGSIGVEDLDPKNDQLYLTVSEFVTSIPVMSAATLSAVVTQAQYTFYRLQRVSDVAHNLVSAYWATTESERQPYDLCHAVNYPLWCLILTH